MADVPGITQIYNDAILHTTVTFALEAKTLKDREEWLLAHVGNHRVIVAVSGEWVLGYASLSTYRPMEAYNQTAELSIYIEEASRGKGLGRMLMEEILRIAREETSLHMIVSVIAGGNEVSNRLHEAFGFSYCGRVKEAGYKFGRYLDIDTYQLILI